MSVGCRSRRIRMGSGRSASYEAPPGGEAVEDARLALRGSGSILVDRVGGHVSDAVDHHVANPVLVGETKELAGRDTHHDGKVTAVNTQQVATEPVQPERPLPIVAPANKCRSLPVRDTPRSSLSVGVRIARLWRIGRWWLVACVCEAGAGGSERCLRSRARRHLRTGGNVHQHRRRGHPSYADGRRAVGGTRWKR